MSLNYHELTMNEPRDSPAKRKQHLVICTIMGVMFLHSGIMAGLFHPMSIEKGEFPGGEFTHKFLTRDYAASSGTQRAIEADLGIENTDKMGWDAPSDSADLLFSVFLDNDGSIPGGMTRYASGMITEDKEKKRMLLDTNSKAEEMTAKDYPKNVKYDVAILPKVNAVTVLHPTTGGVWSALLQQYKIFPALKKYYEELGGSGSFVMISTCSEKQGMCMYYVPLSEKEAFYIGNELTEEYAVQYAGASFVEKFLGLDFNDSPLPSFGIGGTKVSNVFKGIKKLLGISSKTSGKEEL
eukprot:scaffold1024_cov118-Skeletonema_dohrnii-CCMP3373.AAC.6